MNSVENQKVSKGEQKCIDYMISKGLILSEKKSYVYFIGETWVSQNSCFKKQFVKEYTPDIEFELNGKRYWVEIKGMVMLPIKGQIFWIEDLPWKERRPLIIDYCFKNNIIFKQFSSSNVKDKKFGYNDFCSWIEGLLDEK